MRKIIIMGAAFDTGNMGVSALACSLVKLFSDLDPEARIGFFVGAKASSSFGLKLAERIVTVDIINYRMSPRARLKEHIVWLSFLSVAYRYFSFACSWFVKRNPVLRKIMCADIVGDIRGGDSFSDIYGLRGFFLGSLPSIIAILLRKKLILFPQTYGPFKSKAARFLARWILERSDCILSRDKEGLEIVTSMLSANKNNKIEFCPDVAFALDAMPVEQPDIQPPLEKSCNAPLVGFNVNGLLYNGGYTRNNMFDLAIDYKAFVSQLAEEFLQKTDATLLLIPHTFAPIGHVESDPEASQRVIEFFSPRFPGRLHLVSREYNQSEIKNIIGMCDFFIGSRMHACIAALSQNIPSVSVAYSRKFKGVFDSVGLGDVVVDARNIEIDEAIQRIMNAFLDRHILKQTLSDRVNKQKKLLVNVFHRLIFQT